MFRVVKKAQQQLHISLKMHILFTREMLSWQSAFFQHFIDCVHPCILNAYSLYFISSLHTRDSDWTVTETQTTS